MRKVYVYITGDTGAGKTVVANVLRQAFSEDPGVKVIFSKDVGNISQVKDDLEPMEVRVTEGLTLPGHRETQLGWGDNFKGNNHG